MKRDSLVFIKHVRGTINSIENFTKRLSKSQFLNNEEKQYAVVRGIEIIGEAVRNLPLSFREKYPGIPWKDLVGMKNILMHHYFGVDLEYVWKVVKKDIPELKKQIQEILEAEKKK